MNWLILEANELEADGRARLTDERADHVRRVWTIRKVTQVRAGLVGGGRGWAHVEEVGAAGVVLRCEFPEPPLPRSGVSLLLAMPRPKAAKRLWAQLAELGVERVWVTLAEGVEASYLDSHALDPGVIRRRLREGMAQCGETRPPVIEVIRRFEEAVRRVGEERPEAEKLVVDPTFNEPLREGKGQPRVLAIGPERGWSVEELARLRAERFCGVHLGPRILRAETACLVALGRCVGAGRPSA